MANAPEQLLIVGDVHGEADRLLDILVRPECQGRRLVFVGDLVNRGPNSRRVLDTLVALQSATVIRGNHEQALLDVLRGAPILPMLELGGAPTILDYLGLAVGDVATSFREAFPEAHRGLLERSVSVFKIDGLVVSHDGGAFLSHDHERICTKAHEPTPSNEFLVFGHYSQRSRTPLVGERFACIDTGAGSGGPLSAFLWPERTYIQS